MSTRSPSTGSPSTGSPVVGADGCKGRWVVVRADHSHEVARLQAELVGDLGPVIDEVRRGSVAAMAVDMPIGLLDDRPRPCDVAARKVLGERRSTVFPTPVRATLVAADYRHACDLSRAACGKALSKQSYNLLVAIRRLDELLTRDDARLIVEAHPECAFARLAGQPLASKHTAPGREQRIAALDDALGDPFTELRNTCEADGHIPLIDLLDATVLTITARRVVDGSAIRLGGDLDATGKPTQVVY